MEKRLLRRNGDSIERVCRYGHENRCYDCADRTKCNADIFDRLAHYEDMEEQGRLVEIPVKIGEKVHDLMADYIFTVEKIEIGHKYGTLFRCGNPGTEDYMAFYESEIGERVEIVSHAEAEAALAASGKEG